MAVSNRIPTDDSRRVLRAASPSPSFPRLYRGFVRPVEIDSRPTDTTDVQALVDALRDAAGWLQSAGDALRLQSLKDAAARAQATLAEVSSHG